MKTSESTGLLDLREPPSHRVRLPGFITNEAIGLGDVIKRTTSSLGIQPCRGCEHRAAALNRWVVLHGPGQVVHVRHSSL